MKTTKEMEAGLQKMAAMIGEQLEKLKQPVKHYGIQRIFNLIDTMELYGMDTNTFSVSTSIDVEPDEFDEISNLFNTSDNLINLNSSGHEITIFLTVKEN